MAVTDIFAMTVCQRNYGFMEIASINNTWAPPLGVRRHDAQHNDTQHNGLNCDTFAKCRYVECRSVATYLGSVL